MEINKLSAQAMSGLNEAQKYFYEQFNSFIRELDSKYFDLDKTTCIANRIKNDYVIEFKITAKESSWINIDIYIWPDEIIIDLSGWQENIYYGEWSLIELYEKLRKLLIFSLSENCKLIIYKSKDKPYKWNLYAFEEGGWKLYSSIWSLIYNFLGSRRQEEKQSHIFKEASYPKELFEPVKQKEKLPRL